jgi:WD40 repeat protein
VRSVAFSPDGVQIASGSYDNTIELWDTASGRLLGTLEGHSSLGMSVAFSPDGTRIASGSEDHTIKLWDTASGRLLRTFEGHTATVMSVAYTMAKAARGSASPTNLRRRSEETVEPIVDLLNGGVSVAGIAA